MKIILRIISCTDIVVIVVVVVVVGGAECWPTRATSHLVFSHGPKSFVDPGLRTHQSRSNPVNIASHLQHALAAAVVLELLATRVASS
jgi:hypothetical protein